MLEGRFRPRAAFGAACAVAPSMANITPPAQHCVSLLVDFYGDLEDVLRHCCSFTNFALFSSPAAQKSRGVETARAGVPRRDPRVDAVGSAPVIRGSAKASARPRSKGHRSARRRSYGQPATDQWLHWKRKLQSSWRPSTPARNR